MRGVERHFQKMVFPKRQTIVITGGNSGIGFAVASFCVRLGYRVILAVRNETKGEEAKENLLAIAPAASVEVWRLDLAKKESVLAFTNKVKSEGLDVDVFYSNAGIYRTPYSALYGGMESQMAVNFAANLLLFRELEEYLRSLPHIVKWILTSSVVARFPSLSKEDLRGEKNYDKSRAYQKSKLAVNHLYLYMVKKAEGTNILPLLVHPGIVFTPLIAKAYPNKIVILAKRFLRAFFNKPEKAALSTMRLLETDITAPCFCGPRGIGHTAGYPKIYPLYTKNIRDPESFMEATFSFLD